MDSQLVEIISFLPKFPRNAPHFGAGVTEAAGLLSGNPAPLSPAVKSSWLKVNKSYKPVTGLREAEISLVLFFPTFSAREGSFCTEQPLPIELGLVFGKESLPSGPPKVCS